MYCSTEDTNNYSQAVVEPIALEMQLQNTRQFRIGIQEMNLKGRSIQFVTKWVVCTQNMDPS
jgi:hypothetical protein